MLYILVELRWRGRPWKRSWSAHISEQGRDAQLVGHSGQLSHSTRKLGPSPFTRQPGNWYLPNVFLWHRNMFFACYLYWVNQYLLLSFFILAEFKKICASWKTDGWLWFRIFLTDMIIYQVRKTDLFNASQLVFLCRLTLHPASVYICASLGTVSEGPLQPAPDGCSAAASTWATKPLRSGQSGAPQGAYSAGLLPLRTGRVQGN